MVGAGAPAVVDARVVDVVENPVGGTAATAGAPVIETDGEIGSTSGSGHSPLPDLVRPKIRQTTPSTPMPSGIKGTVSHRGHTIRSIARMSRPSESSHRKPVAATPDDQRWAPRDPRMKWSDRSVYGHLKVEGALLVGICSISA